ncbi:hypothetical protein BLS_004426 [Venturia inaequalis]|uniref:UBA domain-containing protein n=1 Tax=Venturia inaequalis TaxID=5025 RepID=A0A8H3V3N7_VENIN|nr:hypothetical protein BLS_004426 [Venturia inaequalis]KAE9980148.1 hypothetical protein EG327_006674 [Venturia inaequalis]RDI85669.1 hypothetical protein Vi05172_g4350 [Venturia inaequalis]
MALEIQDSDDDFAVTSPTRPDEEDQLSSIKALSKTPSRTKSTNETTSTDRLMREIQHAQQELVGSSPARPTHTLTDPMSSPLRVSKRRKTTNSSQAGTPESKLGRTKTMKTYGSSSKRTRGLLNPGSSLFDDLKVDEQKSPHATITQSEEIETVQKSPEKTWSLPASLRQDFQEHEPVSMFPDPSSTVPDNTMTQQRLLEQALSNSMLPPPPQPNEEAAASTTSSFPWSTYLEQSPENKTQTPPKITQISQMLMPDEPSPAAVDPKQLTRNTTLQLGSSDTPPGSPVNPVRMSRTPTSVTKKSSSSKLRRTKTMGAKLATDRTAGTLDDELAMDKPKSTAKRRKSHAAEKSFHSITEAMPSEPAVNEHAPAAPKSTAKRRKSHAVNNSSHPTTEKDPSKSTADTPALVAPEPMQSTHADAVTRDTSGHAPSEPVDRALAFNVAALLSQMQPMPSPQTDAAAVAELSTTVVQKKQKSKDKDEASNKGASSLNPDELAIGLPKEQYKPRPSRSRSARIVEDTSIDYSKRPETLTTSKLKRRKTTNEISSGSPKATIDADKMAQIGSMGFTPRQTKAALEESNGNIERAVEHLLAQPSGDKENSPSKKPSKTRSKSTKQAKATKHPEVTNTASELLTVQVTQGSGDKTFYPTVDESEPKITVAQEKEKDLEDEIRLDSAPQSAIKLAVEEVVMQKTSKHTSSTRKRQREKIADSDDEDEIVAEPGLSKPAPKSASKRKIVDSDGEDEIIAEPEPQLPKSVPRSTTKRKILVSDGEDGFIAEPESPEVITKPQAKRTKSLPTKKSKINDDKENMDIAAPTQAVKKGRGRPKKIVETAVDVEAADPSVTEPIKIADKVTPLKSPEAEIVPSNPEEPKDQIQTPGSTTKSAAIPPSTPEQQSGSSQKSAATKAAVQHSPLNKSKVPLRVGLSRKKRIAPLLKIIKK